ncbi:hypothetical protein [Streptomyces sp. NPDC052494]|uniref:hypothetical protein n=1 Tax=Streptomyces sp. NPDC052494 TaxID=3365692 RepID=UPI0037CE6E52
MGSRTELRHRAGSPVFHVASAAREDAAYQAFGRAASGEVHAVGVVASQIGAGEVQGLARGPVGAHLGSVLAIIASMGTSALAMTPESAGFREAVGLPDWSS